MSRVYPNSERERTANPTTTSNNKDGVASKTDSIAASLEMLHAAAKSNGRDILGVLPTVVPTLPTDLHAKERFDKLDSTIGPRSPTDNRQTWRLLGKAALLARALNPRDDVIDIYHDPKTGSSRFMIHPNSKFRRIWEVLTACCVLYVCVMVPLIIGFNYVEWGDRYIFDTIVDVYFVVDMFVTMRTGILSNGEVIMDSKLVFQRYLHHWLIIDLISNFPLALFVDSSARKSIKMVKLQKLPKLLRIGRLLKYLREYAKYYNLALSFLAMTMALHFLACLWASLFNHCFDAAGKPICESSEMPRMYIQSMHTIMLMFLGIAETSTYATISHLMDPHSEGNTDFYVMSTTVFVVGTVFTAFFFGNIIALIMSWDQQSSQFRNRMDIIAAEMRHYELPEELQHRVRRNYDYLWINQRAYSDMMLLHQPGISKTLRMTIALHLYKDLVKTVPFFAGSDARFLGKVCLALETAVYLPGDTIIYYDDIGKEMFIVRKGLVEIFVQVPEKPEPTAPQKRIYLRDGNFFGETALVIDVRRTNTVKAVTICDLNVLSKTSFNEIVAEYPEFGERMKRTVIKRQLDNMNIQSPSEKLKIQNQLSIVVEKSLKARRMSVSLRTIYRAKKLGDKLKEIADRAAKSNNMRRLSHSLSRLGSDRGSGSSSPQRSPARPVTQSQNLDRSADTSFGGMSSSHSHGNNHIFPTHNGPGLAPIHPHHHPPNRELHHQGSSASSSSRHVHQLDAVSRKLSKAEMRKGVTPGALEEMTQMINQIKRATDRLSRRLQHVAVESSDGEDEDEDEEDDEEQYQSSINMGMDQDDMGLPMITPLSEEHEDEMARRETQSIYIPKMQVAQAEAADAAQ